MGKITMSELEQTNYYENEYDGSFCGLKRYCTNFGKQAKASPAKPIVGLSMAVIEILEFLATMKIVVLITTE